MAIRSLRGTNTALLAFEAVDRHAEGARARRMAIFWHGRRPFGTGGVGDRQDSTHSCLNTNRFASSLMDLGVGMRRRRLALVRERTGIDIPEEDYPALETLSGCINYLAAAR